ncbi:unnamed protein product [Chondrus crispus]|uniref:Uncharacterized protein n=1 Tax=Chondrus crispus TaxID=2769 RepID=R7Q3E5_CHOCR|nr:unnamed protein product [Chondrus crispus]CDF33067.1 unnamed protein product [Chondrus crispus]|eukprot:XP_005712870.1 unnamed protein product [Chondrus crispus]
MAETWQAAAWYERRGTKEEGNGSETMSRDKPILNGVTTLDRGCSATSYFVCHISIANCAFRNALALFFSHDIHVRPLQCLMCFSPNTRSYSLPHLSTDIFPLSGLSTSFSPRKPIRHLTKASSSALPTTSETPLALPSPFVQPQNTSSFRQPLPPLPPAPASTPTATPRAHLPPSRPAF